MSQLGRRGGLKGGRARASALSPGRRAAIARQGAKARWARPALVFTEPPRDHDELRAFVAHYGSTVAKTVGQLRLEPVVLQAVKASRRDTSMARMLPVFLWRLRDRLDLEQLTSRARTATEAATLGYFLELTGALGKWRGFDAAVAKLHARARPQRMTFLFPDVAKHPFEAMAAQQRTPPEARRWGLLTGTPTDSFATYFQKTSDL